MKFNQTNNNAGDVNNTSEPLIQVGKFTLNSGATSNWKLVADDFIRDNLPGLVELVRLMVGPYSSVEGVPRGGTLLADALRPFAVLNGPHLIVDDVLTTGGSMIRAYDAALLRLGRITPVTGAVVFGRGQLPHWVKAVFPMPEVFWLAPGQRGFPLPPTGRANLGALTRDPFANVPPELGGEG